MSIYNHETMILAGDVGGTKTLIGLFEFDGRRPVAIDVRSFPTTSYPGLPAIIEAFYSAQPARPSVTSAAFGVAGPVINQQAQMTNVEWSVDADELRRTFGFGVRLLNDLESMANSLPVLKAEELVTLQAGAGRTDGNIALIAAGTGLGQAVLHYTGGRYLPLPSEGGHADYAARTDEELEFARYLRGRYGRAEVEHVLSGQGLLNLSDFTHQTGHCAATRDGIPDTPAAVSTAALARQCPACVHALDLFVSSYGAAAGNLALTAVTTGGVFIGGGIAPRILSALQNAAFIEAFNEKGPMRPLLEAMPVNVILNPQAGLLGAAVYAHESSR
jgi:glucokinase